MSTDRAPSAVTHECPGKCGTQLPTRLFACTKCWALVPHAMRQNIIRTRPRKYLDAERLQAVHDAEDYLDRLRSRKGGEVRIAGESAVVAEKLDPVAAATSKALESKEYSAALGAACAMEYANRKDKLPGVGANVPTRHRGKR